MKKINKKSRTLFLSGMFCLAVGKTLEHIEFLAEKAASLISCREWEQD
ncbi:MAG: hypothetical protein LBL82_03930 [Oscillospiraceae bacterium]|jgi:hypothetical protein|nr:hypothetical protein [Oscillospiraceae bacterium]